MDMPDPEQVKVWIAILGASLLKWLLTDQEVPAEGEDEVLRRSRRRKSVGSVAAGVFIGYFGHEWVIHRIDWFTQDDVVIVAIALTVTGEAIFKWLMGMGPAMFEKVAQSWFNNRGS